MSNLLDHYREVLNDLESRHSVCLSELKRLEQTIAGLRALMSNSASLFAPARPAEPSLPLEQPETPAGRYAGMSVRWAILKLLAEDSARPMRTPEIAKALMAGGLNGRGDFGASVSAVVSVMAKTRNEVERVPENEGAYRLTDNGRLAWAAIKHSPKYINRAAVATVQ